MSAKHTKLRAVSEGALVKEFAKQLGLVGSFETLEDARGAAVDMLPELSFLRMPMFAYPWLVPVASHLMADEPTHQLAVDMLMTPDTLYVAKDELAKAGYGLFLVWSGTCDVDIDTLAAKGLFNHFFCAGDVVKVNAVQLRSCLKI